MEKEVICLSCPNGCYIVVRKLDSGEYQYQGARCERGEVYAFSEVTDPKRVVTAVVQTDSDELPFIPVKTDKPISKKLIKELLMEIYKQKVNLPIKSGDIIIHNFANTGINVVSTRTYPIQNVSQG